MCGIAGFVSTGRRPALERAIRAMTAAQFHRGPDSGGIAVIAAGSAGFAALGSRRLAIIDRSAAGRQPMTSRTTSAWLVFNGEIYNFAALRNELAGAGYVFQSRTDTEVLLHGYDKWGIEGLLRRLRGMFAFAIWDTRRRRMILARDRLGEKPLHYAFTGGRLIFASELRAVMASRLIEGSLSPAGLYAYLALGSVPAPLTIADPVRALEPGHYAVLAGGRLDLTRYWSVAMAASERLPDRLTEADAADHLRAIMNESVAIRTMSEAPLGVFLSGGIDSSAVLAAIRAGGAPPARAHTLVFPDQPGDEAPFARLAARRAGAELIEHPLRADDLANELPKLACSIDQPSIDGINTYFIAKYARAAGTVVAMSGLGGDELFGGYSSFRRVPRLLRAGAMLRACTPFGRLLTRLIGIGDGTSRAARLRAFLGGEPTLVRAWFALRGLFDDGHMASLVAPDLAAAGQRQFDTFSYLAGLSGEAADAASAVSLLELQVYMHNQLLRDTDVMSMAHGLEVRCPLLDHELVEFVAALPPAWKFGGRPKALLLRALGGMIPPELARRPKSGFTLPFGRWLRDDRGGMIREILDAPSEVIDRGGTLALWADFQRGRVHWSRIWAIVILHLWLREFRQAARPPVTDQAYTAPIIALAEPPPASA